MDLNDVLRQSRQALAAEAGFPHPARQARL